MCILPTCLRVLQDNFSTSFLPVHANVWKIQGLSNFLADIPFLVDNRATKLVPSRLFRFPNPPISVFCHFCRQFLPILCAVFLIGWYGSVGYAQSDTKNQQNRNIRDTRTSQLNPSNPAMMMREMQASLQKLPWNELPPAAQAKIRGVVSGSPLFHRMPQQKVHVDPEIHQFLLRHPDVVIGFWEQLGATQLSLREVRENHYALRETGGTVAAVEVLHRTSEICIVYARGEYRGPLLAKAYQGNVVLVLRTQYTRDEMNEPMIVCDLDAFIQINNVGVDMLAKLFFASLAKVADSNFEITMSFISQVSRAASRTPDIVKDTAEEITSVRQEVYAEFCDVVDMVAMRFARRNQLTPLLTAQQRTQSIVQSRANQQQKGFAISSSSLKDRGMEHFFDSPNVDSPRYDTPQPLYEPVRYESTGELTAPKQVEARRAGSAVPRLPRAEW